VRKRTWLVCLALLLAACGGIGPQKKPELITARNVNLLHGRLFELRHMTLDGNRIVTHVDARMTLAFFPDGQARGFGSVNQFAATYSFSPEGKLTWGKGSFATTRKAGAPELMEKESHYLEGLKQATGAVVAPGGLQLENDDGSTVLVFR
jgi:heat shock protein HslJ